MIALNFCPFDIVGKVCFSLPSFDSMMNVIVAFQEFILFGLQMLKIFSEVLFLCMILEEVNQCGEGRPSHVKAERMRVV